MADAATTQNDVRYLKPANSAKRNTPNVSSGWVVMLLSGLVAAVIFLFATQQGEQRFDVAVLSSPLAPGDAVTSSSFGRASVNVDQAQLDRMIRFEDRAQFEGWILSAPLQQGEIVQKSLLRAPSAGQNRRAMSIPVSKERAVNGGLLPGDRVDVIDTTQNASAGYIARDLEVIKVDASSGGSLSATGGSFSVVVAIQGEEAVPISKAINGGKFDVIRSTGALTNSTRSGSTIADESNR